MKEVPMEPISEVAGDEIVRSRALMREPIYEGK